jgi:hypothetical protein
MRPLLPACCPKGQALRQDCHARPRECLRHLAWGRREKARQGCRCKRQRTGAQGRIATQTRASCKV